MNIENAPVSSAPESPARLPEGLAVGAEPALPNRHVLACMLATWYTGGGALPAGLGLEPGAFRRMMVRYFPEMEPPSGLGQAPALDETRSPEREELLELMLAHRAGEDESEAWIAAIVAAGCMGGDHLWQDLGLWSRTDLTALMRDNFPALAAKNDRDMKWKKFLYKQLCVQEGIYTCRSPSCEVCPDYQGCFGPEE